jgi:hypothetical protein
MKKAICSLFVLCAGAFGQTNAAGDAIQKRVQGLNLLSTPKYRTGYVFPLAAHPLPSTGRTCAIPLLRATGPGTNDSMPVVTPRIEPLRGDLVSFPAPACDEGDFRNK